MIRVLTGRGWRFNPQLLAELKAGLDRSAGRAPPIMDVLGIEIDGIDLFAGMSEDRIVEVTADLATAASRLASGYQRAQVTCSGGAVELLLERRGSRVALSLVRVRRPSAVLVSEVEIELSALTSALLRSGKELLSDLRRIHPRLPGGPPAQRLDRALTGALGRPPRAQSKQEALAGPARPLNAQGHVGAAGFRLEIDDSDGLLESFAGGRPDLWSLLVPGRLVLETGAKLPPWSSQSSPFLLLRDLVQSGLEAVRAIEQGDPEHELMLGDNVALDLRFAGDDASAAFVRETNRGHQLGVQGFQSFDAATLLSALFEAALAFGSLATRQNARQAQNAPLVMLLTDAREGLARSRELSPPPASEPAETTLLPKLRAAPAPEPRLGPGKLKLLSYREAWQRRLGSVQQILALRQAVVVQSEAGVACLGATDGALAWDIAEEGATCVAPRKGGVIVADSKGLQWRDATGSVAWRVPLETPATRLALAFEGSTEVLAASDGQSVLAVSAARGANLWRFAPPGVGQIELLSVRGRLLLWTSDERLYCISPALGRLLWRGRGKPLAGGAMLGDLILVAGKSRGGLRAVSLRTGKGNVLPALELDRPGGTVRLGRLAVVASLEGDGGAVTALTASGAVAWRWTSEERLGPAMPLLEALPDGLLVRSARTLSRLDPNGSVRWSHPLSEHSHDGLRPVARRGVAFAAGDAGLFAFDVETGAVLGQLDAEPPIAALTVDAKLDVYLASDGGPVRALRVQRFLSVV